MTPGRNRWEDTAQVRDAATRTHRLSAGPPADTVHLEADEHGIIYALDSEGVKWWPKVDPPLEVRKARFDCEECASPWLLPFQVSHTKWCGR